MNITEKAVKAAGGQTKVALKFNVSPQAIQQWSVINRVPADRVIYLESLSGVSRHKLRPDVFGRS